MILKTTILIKFSSSGSRSKSLTRYYENRNTKMTNLVKRVHFMARQGSMQQRTEQHEKNWVKQNLSTNSSLRDVSWQLNKCPSVRQSLLFPKKNPSENRKLFSTSINKVHRKSFLLPEALFTLSSPTLNNRVSLGEDIILSNRISGSLEKSPRNNHLNQ